MSGRNNPQLLRPCITVTDEDVASRVQALIARLGGVERARVALGVGKVTLDSARACGRMMGKTRERLMERLAELEEQQQ